MLQQNKGYDARLIFKLELSLLFALTRKPPNTNSLENSWQGRFLTQFYNQIVEADMLKTYKPLNLIANEEDDTGFETLVAEMAEVSSMNMGTTSCTGFSPFGKVFIFLYDSNIAQAIIKNPEIEVELNMDEYEVFPARFNNFKNKEAYFHREYLEAKDKLALGISREKVVKISFAVECKNCYMLTSFDQPILVNNQVKVDRRVFSQVLANQTVVCNWCNNRAKGNDISRFTIYKTTGLSDDYVPTERMEKRSDWYQSLAASIRIVLEKTIKRNLDDYGWTKRCAYCKLVFVGTYEKDEVGFKRGLYDLKKIILEDGTVCTTKESPLFLLDVKLDEELPLEFTVAPDTYTTKSIQTVIYKEPLWATLIIPNKLN